MTLSEQGRQRITDPVEWVQGAIALTIVAAVCWTALSGRVIGPELMVLGTTIVGFYFGKNIKTTQQGRPNA